MEDTHIGKGCLLTVIGWELKYKVLKKVFGNRACFIVSYLIRRLWNFFFSLTLGV